MIRKTFFVTCIVLLIPAFLFAASPLWGTLQAGPHSVGVQTFHKYDYSRPYKAKYDFQGNFFKGERARPLLISVWYPAAAGGGTAITFADYISWTAAEENFNAGPTEKEAAVKAFFKSRWAQGAAEDQLKQAISRPAAAVLDAKNASGKFPLVLIANSTSLSSPYANAILAEYLASNGYIVASSPAIGSMSRQIGFREATVQMRDLEFILNQVHDFPSIDHDKLALIGFGFGGLSTALMTMHNQDVDAVVGLDTAMANKFGLSILFQSAMYNPSRVMVPFLNITNLQPSPVADQSFFQNAKYSNIHHVKLKGMGPVDFSSLALVGGNVPGFGVPPQGAPAQGERNSIPGYEALCRYTLNFLNAYVKKDPKGIEFLNNTPDANGFAGGLVTVERKAALKRPPTEPEFVKIIREKGVESATTIYHEVIAKDPEYAVFEPETLNALAQESIQSKKPAEAISVLKLNMEAYPDDWEVHDLLGNAYAAEGNKSLAVEHFNKSLELNPDNQNATEMLKKLQS